MIKENFNFVKGDSYSKGFIIEGLDMPIKKIHFTVKEKSSYKKVLIQKTLENGILTDLDNPNRYIVILNPEDTEKLKVNLNYVFDIQIDTDTMKKTIVGGYLKLDDWDITNKANEV